ncbi:MAG TPA: hypothetical protein VFS55_07770 [Dokdonella sp.]|nr:hypothetical protein [Dokdonella sp.]
MKTQMMRALALAVSLAAAGTAFARSDIRDGNAMVQPVKGDKYSIDGAIMGKAELYGYMGGMRDDDHITGIVLKRGGSDEQRRVIGSIAKTLGLKSFEQDGGDLKEIPQPATKAPAPAIENPPATTDGQPAAATPAPSGDSAGG